MALLIRLRAPASRGGDAASGLVPSKKGPGSGAELPGIDGCLRARCAAYVLAAIFLTGPFVQAAAPSLEYWFPAGGQTGTTFTVEAGGKFEDWPVEVWVHPAAGLQFTPEEDKGKFQVTIDEHAEGGPRWVRLFNAQGASDPRLFFVDRLPEVVEEKSNDTVRDAQAITNLPAVINGRLEKRGDVDGYAVTLAAGQWLIAEMDAYTLDSPVDPLLHLTDRDGVKLAFQHDGNRLDPRLAWRAPQDGTYVVRAAAFAHPPRADVEFAGDASAVYRLRLFDGPVVAHFFPPIYAAGRTNRWQPFGWNLPADFREWTTWDASDRSDGSVERVWVAGAAWQNLVPLTPLAMLPSLEIEPNNDGDTAQALAVPFVLSGRLQEPGDADRYRFPAAANASLALAVRSAAWGSAVDPVVVIEDETGRELTRQDDSGKNPDPVIRWKAPREGVYTLTVMDLFGRGGPDHVYQLTGSETRPDFEATLETHTLAVDSGGEAEVKFKTKRLDGYDGKLLVQAAALPEGVTGDSVEIPEKGGEVTLTLKAGADATAAQVPIRFRVYHPEDGEGSGKWVRIPYKGKNAEEGDLLLNELPDAWLTVRRPAEDKAKP